MGIFLKPEAEMCVGSMRNEGVEFMDKNMKTPTAFYFLLENKFKSLEIIYEHLIFHQISIIVNELCDHNP